MKINNDSYLTFFHSSGHFNMNIIYSYYMGAYLFQSTPPFAITHMSQEPIVHKTMYNETFGWAYGNLDYVVFPMGVVFDEQVINISYGKNDRDGWILTLDREAFLASLLPVHTQVVGDSKWNQDKTKFEPRSFTHTSSSSSSHKRMRYKH